MAFTEKLIAVFDIGSSSVGGALFLHSKNKKPELITSLRQQAEFPEKSTFPVMSRKMRQAIDSVVKGLKKENERHPDLALCVFSSPWYVAQTKIVKVRREASFKISEKLMEKIIEDETLVFRKQWTSATKFLEQESIKTILGGYDIKNPIDKSTKNLEIYIYLSMGLEEMKEAVEQDLSSYINHDHLYFHSFPFVFFKVLKQIINIEQGLLLIDITGEITDVLLIRNNIIEEVNSFSKGENFFIRRLASGFNISFEEASSLISQYRKQELHDLQLKKVEQILKPAADEWGVYLEKVLSGMSADHLLPQDIYFCGPVASLPEVNNQFLKENLTKFTIFGKSFDIHFLLPDSLKYHFNFKRGSIGYKDIFLLISSLFAEHFIAQK